ncbi:MAG: Fic/DOC family N-terminal domain-containing protein [Vampirovibrionales bacterium]|nr:Fic/DOC family N-terminal domain-containing protein [Vampirovibrionales bacterium]
MPKPFVPHRLPIEDQLDWRQLSGPLSRATSAVTRYDECTKSLLNADLLLGPLLKREAELSSRIEGTLATLNDVFYAEAGAIPKTEEIKHDVQEIQNYQKALLMGKDWLEDNPLSLLLVRQLHQILMDSVRGADKNPGQIRTNQNAVGRKSGGVTEARYLPPSPELLQEFLENWQAYLQQPSETPLVQAAVMFAQFEVIHPFSDGNGRLGRLLIPLFLKKMGVLNSPTFYLSEYLEQHREENNDRLLAISEDNDWQGWVLFFLGALEHQASQNCTKANLITQLYSTLRQPFQNAANSQHAAGVQDAFFTAPVMRMKTLQNQTRIKSRATLYRIVEKLLDAGLLKVSEKAGQNASLYYLPSLLELL